MPARITTRVNDDRRTTQVTVRSEDGAEHLVETAADEIEDATLALINARDALDPPFPERGGIGHTGSDAVEDVIARWKASPGHNQNMLLPQVTLVGLARVETPGSGWGRYWALVLSSEQ